MCVLQLGSSLSESLLSIESHLNLHTNFRIDLSTNQKLLNVDNTVWGVLPEGRSVLEVRPPDAFTSQGSHAHKISCIVRVNFFEPGSWEGH